MVLVDVEPQCSTRMHMANGEELTVLIGIDGQAKRTFHIRMGTNMEVEVRGVVEGPLYKTHYQAREEQTARHTAIPEVEIRHNQGQDLYLRVNTISKILTIRQGSASSHNLISSTIHRSRTRILARQGKRMVATSTRTHHTGPRITGTRTSIMDTRTLETMTTMIHNRALISHRGIPMALAQDRFLVVMRMPKLPQCLSMTT